MGVKLNVLLLIALVASGLVLVDVSYESRRLFSALDRAQAQALKLESDHESLQLERRAQATPLRVEKVARDRLAMRNATPAVSEYVAAPGATRPASAPASAPAAVVLPQPAPTSATAASGLQDGVAPPTGGAVDEVAP
jgi:cell division protein FtsL